jgi:putative transposase
VLLCLVLAFVDEVLVRVAEIEDVDCKSDCPDHDSSHHNLHHSLRAVPHADCPSCATVPVSLGKESPEPRPVQVSEIGPVVSVRQVGGLHHRYDRRAA